MSLIERASEIVDAFASADVDRARNLCARELVLFGTDIGEVWLDRESFLVALEGMQALGLRARWLRTPVAADDWVAGEVEFNFPDGTVQTARVTMVCTGEKLVHAHYSFASEASAS
jgi:hypothetical protein